MLTLHLKNFIVKRHTDEKKDRECVGDNLHRYFDA